LRADFANADAAENEEARTAIGDALDSPKETALKGDRVQVAAFVDESGKILDASGSSDAAAAAKSFALPLIAWPDHELRSVRTVELMKDGSNWKLIQSFVVKPAQEVEP
jgi:hypothetical protein